MNESSRTPEVTSLQARIAALEDQLTRAVSRLTTLEDVDEIKKLQRIYGYYVDKALWGKVIDLFSEDCAIEISGRGVYLGRHGAEMVFRKLVGQLISQNSDEGLSYGQLHNHFQLQGVVNVAPDGCTAKGRWRAFIQVAVFGKLAHWSEGPYEMEYVKQDGIWRISKLTWFPTYYTSFENGWAKEGLPRPTPSTDYPPDRPPTYDYETYPATFVPPFHFRHPVTGKD